MPTALTIGPIHSLVANTWYAMPARSTRGYTNTSLLTVNFTATTTGATAVTTAAGEFSTAAPLISATGTTSVRLVAL